MSLPKQGTATGKPWSLARDNQLRDALLDLFAATMGNGVISGGTVTSTGTWSVEVAAGTIIVSGGVALTLAAAVGYAGPLTASSTNYLWGKIVRTAANQTLPAALDTYALSLTHNTTGTAPSADHRLLATITTSGAGITAIDSNPVGARQPATIPGALDHNGLQAGFFGASLVTQPAGAAQAVVTLGNTDGEIGGLTFSDPPTQAECQALRDKCEELADDVRAVSALLHALRTALVSLGLAKGSA